MTVETRPPASPSGAADPRGPRSASSRPLGGRLCRPRPQARGAASAAALSVPDSREPLGLPKQFASPSRILPPKTMTSLPRDRHRGDATLKPPPWPADQAPHWPRAPTPRPRRHAWGGATEPASERLPEASGERRRSSCDARGRDPIARDTEGAHGRRLWPVFWELSGGGGVGLARPLWRAEVSAPVLRLRGVPPARGGGAPGRPSTHARGWRRVRGPAARAAGGPRGVRPRHRFARWRPGAVFSGRVPYSPGPGSWRP